MTGTRTEQEYAALYQEHSARLVAYARSLTGNAAVAEDLAAEAHFRVWRRISAGHTVDNPSAYLTTTVRNLAAGLGRAQREIARDVADLPEDPERAETVAEDPERRASHVDLISRLLKELPERWAKALWYAEVEDLPMDAVGERIGASAGTTAVVLTRARERLRQAFLLSQPGTPVSEECEQYWKQMPTLVRGTASARRTRSVLEHSDGCADCRARMLALTEANTRLPALLGPALLGIVLGGGAWFLPAVAGAGARAAAGAAGKAGAATRVGSRLARHGLSPTKATVYGSVAAVGIAVAAATIALGSTPPSHPTAAIQPQATAHPTVAAKQAAAASDPTSVATTTAATPSATSTSPTSKASAAHDAANPAQQTPAAASTSSVITPTAVASTTAPAAPTTSTTATPFVADSPSDTAAASATPTLTPTLTPTPSPPASSPTQSPTSRPTGSGPTSPPSCELEVFGFCVIW